MLHPYQCLCYCPQASQFEAGIIVGASGCSIHAFSAKSGKHLSTWPSLNKNVQTRSVRHKSEDNPEAPYSNDAAPGDIERPPKRQKLSLAKDESGSSSAEIVVTRDSDDDPLSSSRQPSKPPVIKLASTSDGQQVIAVTGEDKCIRVFDLATDGTITQLSERIMPKKPCAIVLTPDDSTILCADKFGDVYSLPISGQASEAEAVNSADVNDACSMTSLKPRQRLFAPSATSLTVHTKRNRDALRQQQKTNNPKADKKSLNFDHKLLLGHVSLLTDVACVNLASPSHKARSYILTSDRDEHIRVSRGIPQAHVIDGYCLGHTEFITKLCVPPIYSHLLISGGGDDHLILWDWPTGRRLQQLDLKSLVAAVRMAHFAAGISTNGSEPIETTESEVDKAFRICVSNIQALEIDIDPHGQPRAEIVVTCQGVPALFTFTLREKGKMHFHKCIRTESNVIDLTVLRNQTSIVYSMDSLHQTFTTDSLANIKESNSRSLVGSLTYDTDTEDWKENEALQEHLAVAVRQCADSNLSLPQVGTGKGKSLTELLYGSESLRKRGPENESDV